MDTCHFIVHGLSSGMAARCDCPDDPTLWLGIAGACVRIRLVDTCACFFGNCFFLGGGGREGGRVSFQRLFISLFGGKKKRKEKKTTFLHMKDCINCWTERFSVQCDTQGLLDHTSETVMMGWLPKLSTHCRV